MSKIDSNDQEKSIGTVCKHTLFSHATLRVFLRRIVLFSLFNTSFSDLL